MSYRTRFALVSGSLLSSNRRVSHWIVILLGIVEGVTEFLPVSSTGHLLLVERWLEMPSQPTELFNVVIQSGAVLAVLLAFAGRVRQMLRDWRTPVVRDYAAKLAAAFVLTACVGLVLKKLGLKLPENAAPVAWATLIGGIVILAVERVLGNQSGATVVTWPVAVAVGLAQLLAMSFPGTSRSGASIIIALLFGLSRPAATEFSFLVGVPTLLAAGGFKIVSALRHPGEAHEPWFQILLGTVVAAITAFIVVRWLLRFVQNHTFVVFGWYRVVLGGLILVFLVYRP
jgi:undecaprenyl-diphosphatase